jgi:hypothetical protein
LDTLELRTRDLFGNKITVAQILDAFTIDHTENGERFIARAEAALGKEGDIEIRGRFYRVNGDAEEVGCFMRRLLRKNDNLRAHHMNIEIVERHQFKHISEAHYRKALQFYIDAGVVNVFMEANRDGPAVWPGFGFDLVEGGKRDRLRALVETELAKYDIPLGQVLDVSKLHPVTPLLIAVEIEVPNGKGGEEIVYVGQSAMRKLYDEGGEELRMTWWLDQPTARPYLEELGVTVP